MLSKPCLTCFVHVQCVEKRSWFNLAAQEIQPLYYHTQLDSQCWLRSHSCPEDAWNGGCSLILDGFIPAVRMSPISAKCVSVQYLFTLPTVTSLNTSLFLSPRIFSLNVALPSKTLVRLIYKASAGITVSVELKTAQTGDCQSTYLLQQPPGVCS